MNTKEQELFWQAVGFKKKRRKVGKLRRTVLVIPNSTEIWDSCHPLHYPVMDANNFFKWVLPKFWENGAKLVGVEFQSVDRDYVFDLYELAWKILSGKETF